MKEIEDQGFYERTVLEIPRLQTKESKNQRRFQWKKWKYKASSERSGRPRFLMIKRWKKWKYKVPVKEVEAQDF